MRTRNGFQARLTRASGGASCPPPSPAGQQVNTVAFVDNTTIVSGGHDGCLKTWVVTHAA